MAFASGVIASTIASETKSPRYLVLEGFIYIFIMYARDNSWNFYAATSKNFATDEVVPKMDEIG